MIISIAMLQDKMEQLKLNHSALLIGECKCKLVNGATKEQMSVLDFFEKSLSLEIQSREERRIASSLKVSGLPIGMHLENFDFLHQPSVKRVEIIVNPNYPFLYSFRKGGLNGQKEETFHA
jgi:DNA replication protein DnaC